VPVKDVATMPLKGALEGEERGGDGGSKKDPRESWEVMGIGKWGSGVDFELALTRVDF
jgi:hypothetical protein